MISPLAIKEFIERPRRDFRPWKDMPEGDLQDKVARLPVKPPLWSKLTRHQRVCFVIGAATRRFVFLLSTGMGKTLLGISLAAFFERMGPVSRTLVLVPNKVNKTEWQDEVQKHAPNMEICVLEGSSKQKWELLESTDAQFVVETYAGFTRMVSELVPTEGGKSRLKPTQTQVNRVLARVQGLILDESTKVKNKDSLAYRVSKFMAKQTHFCYAMTGTPFGRDPIDLWAQFHVVDEGKTLGENITLYREALFTKIKTPWAIEWNFNKKKEPLLHRMIASSSIRYEPEEGDLPKCSEIVKEAFLPAEAESYYRKMKAEIIEASGGGKYADMKNAFMRMRQISSGFFGLKDDETGERIQVEFEECPKREMLISMLEEIAPAHKAIVFHDFIYSGRKICEDLKQLDIDHELLNGKTKDTEHVLDRFKRDDNCRVLVLNTAAGGMGLNLQVAKYGIYYESPVSVIMRKQSTARFVRQHSEHERVFLYDLITKGTLDQKILDFHKEGHDLFKAIVDGKVRL